MEINKQELDNYITGHWGEDQLTGEEDFNEEASGDLPPGITQKDVDEALEEEETDDKEPEEKDDDEVEPPETPDVGRTITVP